MTDDSGGDALVSVAVAVLVIAGVAALVLLWPWRSAPVDPDGLSPPGSGTDLAALRDQPATLLAAGDIADCGAGAAATARLIEQLDGVVAPLGDLAYPDVTGRVR